MFCYHCGCRLSEHDFCTACGADVSLYKRILHVSNMFYNEGLEKAGVRDLSGAVVSLRQSVKFNKNNIEARNLLGLVYFEMGEVVAALSEWVISKNLRSDKNIADDYIEMIQSNSSRLDAINQTIKKYNQSLMYCMQDSKDLAVIQLKKVLSLNPKFIRAHQLLALLYIDSEQWERAKRELNKCMDIDRNNIMTLRYMKEVDLMLVPDEIVKPEKRRKNDDSVRYRSDNEIIIQPLGVKDTKRSGVASVVNIAIGLVIGVAAACFLVVPSAVANVNNQAQLKYTELGNEMSAKAADNTQLKASNKALEQEIEDLRQEIDGYVGTDGTLSTIDNLLQAASTYLETGDLKQTEVDLEIIEANVNIEEMSTAYRLLYQNLLAAIGPQLSVGYYNDGYSAYNSNNFTEAIENLEKTVYYDPENRDALYYLGMSYLKNGDDDKAIEVFGRVVELFPGTERAKRSQRYIDDLTAG